MITMTEPKKKIQKRSLETRQKIIRTAEELFAQYGFDATNTNMIAKEAEISVGSIYTHFKDKWEIFLIILEQYRRKIYEFAKESIDRILREEDDLGATIKWAIPALYEINRINANLSRELERFVLVDERAAEIDARQEMAEDELILKLLNHFSDQVLVTDPESTATIINLQLRVVFRHLIKNRGEVDEKAILNAFTEMFLNSISR